MSQLSKITSEFLGLRESELLTLRDECVSDGDSSRSLLRCDLCWTAQSSILWLTTAVSNGSGFIAGTSVFHVNEISAGYARSDKTHMYKIYYILTDCCEVRSNRRQLVQQTEQIRFHIAVQVPWFVRSVILLQHTTKASFKCIDKC